MARRRSALPPEVYRGPSPARCTSEYTELGTAALVLLARPAEARMVAAGYRQFELRFHHSNALRQQQGLLCFRTAKLHSAVLLRPVAAVEESKVSIVQRYEVVDQG